MDNLACSLSGSEVHPSGSNTSDIGASLEAQLVTAALKTAKISWWEQGNLNGTVLDLLGPAGWP